MTTKRLDVDLGGQVVAVTLKRHRRAKNLILRADPDANAATVTLPPRATIADARDLVVRHGTWLLESLARAPKRMAFVDGVVVPYRGVDHVIRHVGGRGAVSMSDGLINVHGAIDHLPRRLTDWFRAQARTEITALADEKVAQLGLKRGRITIRDTKSRWGSCAAGGNLNFSWRLILAPDAVLDYVVAHEVAHLKHMNHSPAFWAQVAELTDHAGRAKTWLKANGANLFLYG